jgi:hypothetical protein
MIGPPRVCETYTSRIFLSISPRTVDFASPADSARLSWESAGDTARAWIGHPHARLLLRGPFDVHESAGRSFFGYKGNHLSQPIVRFFALDLGADVSDVPAVEAR